MADPQFLDTPSGRRLAYHKFSGRRVGVVFLGGLRSDMTGTKAVHLEGWARRSGREFLRFDYSGHGESSGTFEEGCVGDWAEDAAHAITALTEGPQIIVGSSLGGWIGLLIAKYMPERTAGLVTIAGAPDFTEIGYWEQWNKAQREEVMGKGRIALPSEYGDDLVITKRMIEDGRDHRILTEPLNINVPVRLMQGTLDEDVPMETALRLLDHLDGPDIRLELVKDADHRFSSPACLDVMTRAVADLVFDA